MVDLGVAGSIMSDGAAEVRRCCVGTCGAGACWKAGLCLAWEAKAMALCTKFMLLELPEGALSTETRSAPLALLLWAELIGRVCLTRCGLESGASLFRC